jgi:2-C-methyl-D-erythritol 4-phosphate cytidylyltransferase
VKDPTRLIAIVPAAGGGARFGARLPKQYADLAGKAVLARTLDRLAGALPLAATLVALAPGDAHYAAHVGARPHVTALHCGGATRGETVRNALAALAPHAAPQDWVVVHDAARPCVPPGALSRLVDLLRGDPVGGLLAVPVADTLKRGDGATPVRVVATADRTGLWQAQTPQMFRYGILREAYADDAALAATDESQAVEALAVARGLPLPRLIAGSAQNIKITFAQDLVLAAAILAAQERGSG